MDTMLHVKTEYQSRITAAITVSATSLVVESLTDIPAVSFMAILDAGKSTEEVVLVTAKATPSKTLTVTRAQRGTTAVAHVADTLFHQSEIELADLASNTKYTAAGNGIYLNHILTLATAGALKSVRSEIVYQPSSGGYASPIAVVGKVSLGESAEFTGGQGGMYGLQGQLNFKDGAIVNQASSIFAGLRSVITSEGTPVFTSADTIACIYCDNLCAIDLRGVGVANGSAFASFQNHGKGIDHLIHVHGSVPSPITNIFSIQGAPGFMSGGAAAGAAAKMKMLWGTTTYYINVYQA